MRLCRVQMCGHVQHLIMGSGGIQEFLPLQEEGIRRKHLQMGKGANVQGRVLPHGAAQHRPEHCPGTREDWHTVASASTSAPTLKILPGGKHPFLWSQSSWRGPAVCLRHAFWTSLVFDPHTQCPATGLQGRQFMVSLGMAA